MKILRKSMDREGGGRLTLLPEHAEDMWDLYNLLAAGDTIKTKTTRKIQTDASGGKSATAHRKVLTLILRLVRIEYDAVSLTLRVAGINIGENEFVRLGQHHTFTLQLGYELSVGKGSWDPAHMEHIKASCDRVASAELAAVTMEPGVAHISLITPSMTLTRETIESGVPRKSRACYDPSSRDKAMEKFFDKIISAMERHVHWEHVKVCVIGSPGFLREQFLEYLFHNSPEAVQHKSRFVSCLLHSAHRRALAEALADPGLRSQLADVKACEEARALELFFKNMNEDPDTVCYGPRHVAEAITRNAVDTLLLCDTLLSAGYPTRRRYVALVDNVHELGGKVLFFSSLHVTGRQLAQMSGIAALLRYPLPELDSIVETLAPLEEHGVKEKTLFVKEGAVHANATK